jgi:hypothetical protein
VWALRFTYIVVLRSPKNPNSITLWKLWS